MKLNYAQLSECDFILNNWIKEKCDCMDLLVVNNVPILADDCLAILQGSIADIENFTDKLIVTTTDNKKYVLELFKEIS
ncbi:hypothetical protein [Clostridium sp.]|uniref:hypothetical protein n=1 Tax=Clostridium sp. TaxID=1506 RepID=UPI00261870E8|nr:hypothetical protein [Clostridium sp.]